MKLGQMFPLAFLFFSISRDTMHSHLESSECIWLNAPVFQHSSLYLSSRRLSFSSFNSYCIDNGDGASKIAQDDYF